MERNHGSYRGRATPEQVEQIRALDGVITHDEIAKRFGFTRQNISAIIAGKTFNKPFKLPPLLTPEQVRTIREIGDSKKPIEIAKQLGIDRGRVYSVLNGKRYQDVR